MHGRCMCPNAGRRRFANADSDLVGCDHLESVCMDLSPIALRRLGNEWNSIGIHHEAYRATTLIKKRPGRESWVGNGRLWIFHVPAHRPRGNRREKQQESFITNGPSIVSLTPNTARELNRRAQLGRAGRTSREPNTHIDLSERKIL